MIFWIYTLCWGRHLIIFSIYSLCWCGNFIVDHFIHPDDVASNTRRSQKVVTTTGVCDHYSFFVWIQIISNCPQYHCSDAANPTLHRKLPKWRLYCASFHLLHYLQINFCRSINYWSKNRITVKCFLFVSAFCIFFADFYVVLHSMNTSFGRDK